MSAAEAAQLVAAGLLAALGAVLVAAGGFGMGILAILGAVGLCYRFYRHY